MYNNEQAKVAQASELGVPIENLTVSCISLADDTILLANYLYDLDNLLFLTKQYCLKYDVVLVPDKTHLVAFHSQRMKGINDEKNTSHLVLNGQELSFTDQVQCIVQKTLKIQSVSRTEYLLTVNSFSLFSLLG